MHRLGTIAAFALCIHGRAEELPRFKATVRLVKADTYVYDRDSRRPVFGLQSSDFVLFDQDQSTGIEYFAGESGPVDIIFLLDISGTVRDMLPQFAAVSTAALSVLEQGDRAAVMGFTTRTVLTQPLSGDFKS